ncbi:unnamed protein product [Closterium sp. Yama58-4]|nr:unnamed protein product [Closterium sp. Yama58-4]
MGPSRGDSREIIPRDEPRAKLTWPMAHLICLYTSDKKSATQSASLNAQVPAYPLRFVHAATTFASSPSPEGTVPPGSTTSAAAGDGWHEATSTARESTADGGVADGKAGGGGARWAQARAPEWEERVYARGVRGYNNVLQHLADTNRAHLVRDVWGDMGMDGVAPDRTSFHLATAAAMKAGRLHDVLFFFNHMKTRGIVPDVAMHNMVISACAICLHVDHAFKVPPLLPLHSVPCYRCSIFPLIPRISLLILPMLFSHVHHFLSPVTGAIPSPRSPPCCKPPFSPSPAPRHPPPPSPPQVLALLDEARALPSEEPPGQGEDVGGDEGEQELGGGEGEEKGDEGDHSALAGATREEAAAMQGGTVQSGTLQHYMAALTAMETLRDPQGAEQVMAAAREDGVTPNAHMHRRLIRVYASAGQLQAARAVWEAFVASGGYPGRTLFLHVAEAAMAQATRESTAIARQYMEEFFAAGYFLNPTTGARLLKLASIFARKSGDPSCAAFIFDRYVAAMRDVDPDALCVFASALLDLGVPRSDAQVHRAHSLAARRRAVRLQAKARAGVWHGAFPPPS